MTTLVVFQVVTTTYNTQLFEAHGTTKQFRIPVGCLALFTLQQLFQVFFVVVASTAAGLAITRDVVVLNLL